jgi:alpha/beta superfamily hydrolase
MHSHGLFVECADALCDEGFMVLRFDFRGSEHSEGEFSQVTVREEVSDLRRTLKILSKLGCDHKRLGVLGYSLGGLVALKGAKEDAKAMVLWAPTSRPAEEFKRILGDAKILELERKGYTWFVKDPSPYRRTVRFKVGLPFWREIQRLNPAREAEVVKCPVRVIHGVKDDLVDYRHSIELVKHFPGQSDLKLIEDANHLFDKREHATRLVELTVEWFKKWV